MKYRFSKSHRDPDVMRIQKEIEDNFAQSSDVDLKQNKVTNVDRNPPSLRNLSDGEKRIYFDGTDTWKYERYGGKLYKTQITGV